MNQTRYRKLKSHFPGKKLARFISTTRFSKLSFRERWVYSTLLWRFKCHPVSKARLAKWTGVDRTRTLPQVLHRLTNLRLVAKTGQKFRAVLPPEDMMNWFATYVVGEGQQERLVPAYNWAVYDPSKNIIDGLVACADAQGHHAAAKLAKRFGVCAKTITAARRRLKGGVPKVAPVEPTIPAVMQPEPQKEVVAPKLPEPAVIRPLDPAQQLAKQCAEYYGITADAGKELLRLSQLLRGLPTRDIGQIIAALVHRYGVAEGLADAVDHLIRVRYDDYLYGTTLKRVLGHIGVGQPSYSDADDDPSMLGDECDVESFLLEPV